MCGGPQGVRELLQVELGDLVDPRLQNSKGPSWSPKVCDTMAKNPFPRAQKGRSLAYFRSPGGLRIGTKSCHIHSAVFLAAVEARGLKANKNSKGAPMLDALAQAAEHPARLALATGMVRSMQLHSSQVPTRESYLRQQVTDRQYPKVHKRNSLLLRAAHRYFFVWLRKAHSPTRYGEGLQQ